MAHDPEDGFVEVFKGPLLRGDVMMEATFLNPAIESEERWTHGFLLRGEGRNYFHAIFIERSGTWRHSYRRGLDDKWTTLQQDVTSAIDTNPDGVNQLRLIIVGDRGWLYINEQPQGTLDLSAVSFNQALLALTNEVADGITAFQDFTVWTWHPSLAELPSETPTPSPDVPYTPIYGPAHGSILHELEYPTNSFELFRGPTVEEDVMVEATFHNPYPTSDGSWNYGFLLRNVKTNVYHWIHMTESSWVHKSRFAEDRGTLEVWNTRSADIDKTTGGKNTLRLVIIEDAVWVFINGKFQGNTSLSGITGASPATLVVNDELDGVTRFEGFTVWKWHPSLQELPDEN